MITKDKFNLVALLLAFSLQTEFCALCQQDTNAISKEDVGNWGFGMEFGPCTGLFFVTGEAKEKIHDGWCYANAGLTFSWKKIYYTFHIGGISASLKDSLEYGTGWKKDNSFGSSHLHLSAAYELVNNRYVSVLPFINGGLTAFNSGSDSAASNPTATGWKPSYSIGTMIDFKWNSPLLPKNRDQDFVYGYDYISLKLVTAIYPTYFQNPFRLQGAMYYLGLNLAWYVRASKR